MIHTFQKISLVLLYLFSYGSTALLGSSTLGLTAFQGIAIVSVLLFQWFISGSTYSAATGALTVIPSTVLLLALLSIDLPYASYAVYAVVFVISSFILSRHMEFPKPKLRTIHLGALLVVSLGCGLLSVYLLNITNPRGEESFELLYVPVFLVYILSSEWFYDRILILSLRPFGTMFPLIFVSLITSFPAFYQGFSYGVVMFIIQLYSSALFLTSGKLTFSFIFRTVVFISYMYPFVSVISP